MNKLWLTGGAIALASALALAQAPGGAAVYEGARLIIGDARAPIDNGAIVVQNGRITAVGRKGAVAVPAGATHVDLTGKTVMPAMINAHVHIGYEGYTSWGAENYTPQNVLDHLQREAFYGVGATQSVGSSPTEPALQFQRDQQAGKFAPASRFFFMPGMAPPHGGPDHVLMAATDALHVVNEVTTPEEARAAVRAMAAKKIGSVKIWVDDRRGTYPKLSPETCQGDHRRGARAQDARQRARDDAGRSEGGRARRRRRPRPSRPGREARRGVPRAAEGEEAVLGDGDRARRSHRGVHARSVLRGVAARGGGREDPRDRRAAGAGAVLRPGVAERGAARGDRLLQLPEDDRLGRADRARHRHRPSSRPHVRHRRSPRARALGAARAVAGGRDRRGDVEAGRAARDRRHGDAGRRQERRLRGPRRQPARRHPQHAEDRERLPARAPVRSRRAAREMARRQRGPGPGGVRRRGRTTSS